MSTDAGPATTTRPTTQRSASFAELDAGTLYALLKLRVDVFVVEQECAYPELDGRDTEPDTRHLWLEDDHGPAAYLRILADPDDVARIGRVVVRADARGRQLAGQVMAAALTEIGDRAGILSAQAHLVGFYRRFGFVPTGPEFLEDGIPHLPMARPAAR
ncbi:MAG TPA: GNAT family N-acetyltransferase [Jiangellaceae bacterium]